MIIFINDQFVELMPQNQFDRSLLITTIIPINARIGLMLLSITVIKIKIKDNLGIEEREVGESFLLALTQILKSLGSVENSIH